MSMQATSFHKHLEQLQERFPSLDDGSVADYIPELSKAGFDWLFWLRGTVLSRLAARCGSATIDPEKSFALSVAIVRRKRSFPRKLDHLARLIHNFDLNEDSL